MPTGPQGQKRPRDFVEQAVMIGRISVGEIEDTKAESAKKKPQKRQPDQPAERNDSA